MLPTLPETTKTNLERLWTLTQRAQQLSAGIVATTAAKAAGREFSIVDAQSVGSAFLHAMQELAQRPWQVAAYQQSLFFDVARAWTGATKGEEPPADRRFRDPKWEQDPTGRALRDAHLAIENATVGLLKALPQGSKEQLRAEFYTRQLLSALSPSNFLMLNPAARDRFFETEGKSLVDGFENLLDDLEEGGRLDISTNDREAFVVGRDLATTPGKVVWQTPLMQLIQYEPTTETQFRRPLLFVPAWINKFYILDMRPKNSVVRYALDRGHTVFVISWVNPGKEHAEMSFEDYMKHGPLAALDAIEKLTGERQVDILGFCIGGILVTATLAYLAAKGEGARIATATTLATMVDFTDVGELGVFIDRDRLATLRAHMAETGYLENHHLQDMFSMIRENDLVWSFHVMNYLMGHRPPAFDLLYWNADSTRLPAAMLLWYLEKIYIENGLRKPGHLTMDGVPIDISKVTTPCFVLATKEDHIAPWTSVYPTTHLLGGEVRFVLGGSGHIAGVINPPGGRQKYGYWTRDDYPASPQEWLDGATFTSGSWWPTWAEWMEARADGEKVPARHPGAGGRGRKKALERAPGSFVAAP
ncbi:class I poly(R)-hydroxyalkanoic acid synthase [Amaricoccus sp.]|uniref:PHA/PHB synthase family protein n=1 Tax=Amaricoccus sp. TaxID=1872485 RepID=UPI001B6546FA|nr:class I poly(R)-hydroxyalkanoic acid synthase [Amaricoccus sp.]MBP7240947.1 class I poly(R)-hydroxyalkanoic acid synthase [Amaricoccus sp.]